MKLFSRILIGLGAIFASLFGFVALFNNDEVRARVKAHYHDSLQVAREAAAAKQAALETEIERMKAE